MTKFSHEIPPIYYTLKETFGVVWEQGLIIAYGDTVYSYKKLEPDEIVHEETHLKQQAAIGIEEWWIKYLADPAFRLKQEVEAYKAQVEYLRANTETMTRDERRFRIGQMARVLSSSVYGNLVTYESALTLIK